jgi:dihydroorotase/N-acyl-D-amino-acid deacylase
VEHYDSVLAGLLVDGTGAPGFDGWVAVQGGRIAAVERSGVARPSADVVQDTPGTVVTPGFIDVHTHSDLTAVAAPTMESTLRQGVTTVVVGNCGGSPAPLRRASTMTELMQDWGSVGRVDSDATWASFGEYLDAVAAARPAVNVAALVGFGTLRRLVLDELDRPATPEQAVVMREALRRGLDDGAVGLSTGLIYEPDQSASREELLTVAGGLDDRGVYASHVRGEGRSGLAAVDEALDIGRTCGVRVQVSHVKCESSHAWGRMGELLERLRDARHGGVEAWADSYPYTAYETSLAAFLPPWAPPERLGDLLRSPGDRQRLRRSVELGEPDWQSSVDGVGWERIVVDHHRDSANVGRDVASLAGEEDVLDVVARLLAEDPGTWVIGHAMREEDVREAVAAPDVMVASDGMAVPAAGPISALARHPRSWGTFPRVLGHYVRDQGALSLEAAVHTMTGLPAAQFGLGGRGVLRVGAPADLVVLDPATVAGPADFGAVRQPPVGIETVLVNGVVAWSQGRLRERAGLVLR